MHADTLATGTGQMFELKTLLHSRVIMEVHNGIVTSVL